MRSEEEVLGKRRRDKHFDIEEFVFAHKKRGITEPTMSTLYVNSYS